MQDQKGEKLIQDSRFGKLFTEEAFKIDRNSEAFKLLKPQVSKKGRKEEVDSVDEEDDNPKSGADLNKLFAGNAADESDEEKDFETKLNKKQRRANKKKQG